MNTASFTLTLVINGLDVETVNGTDGDAVAAIMRRRYLAESEGKTATIAQRDVAPVATEDDEEEPTVHDVRSPVAPTPATLAPVSLAGLRAPTGWESTETPTPVSRSHGDTTYSPIAAKRIAEQARIAAASGFSLPDPLFAPGTRVISVGEDNFAAERAAVAELPTFDSARRALTSRIANEDRKDLVVTHADLAMYHDGSILVNGVQHSIQKDAFSAFATRAGFGCGTQYLVQRCDPARRAYNVNQEIWTLDPALGFKLRTRRTANGERSIYAVTSPQYAAVDAPEVLAAAAAAIGDANAEITYDGSSTRATCLWMPDTVIDLAAGDIFKAGIRISTDDTGRGRIRVEAVLFRNLCLNLIIIGEASKTTLDQVHRGDTGDIVSRIKAAAESAAKCIDPFLDMWGKARKVRVEDPIEALRSLVYGGALAPATKGEREGALAALTAAFAVEPGNTLADLVNAATRAAHESTDLEADYRDFLERRAASLVLVPR